MVIASKLATVLTAVSVLLTSVTPPALAHVHEALSSEPNTEDPELPPRHSAHPHSHDGHGHPHVGHGPGHHHHDHRSDEPDHGEGGWHLHVVLLGVEFPIPWNDPGEQDRLGDDERVVRVVDEQATDVSSIGRSWPACEPSIEVAVLAADVAHPRTCVDRHDSCRNSLCDAARFERSGVLLT